MFFKSKRETITNELARLNAEYFDVALELSLSWIEVVDEQNAIITLPFCFVSQRDVLVASIQQNWRARCDVPSIEVRQHIPSFDTAKAPVTNIKNIIAVASGKGGVGKSASSVNLAFALMQEGASVGILDADIYGPSIPIMLGNPGAHPDSSDNKHMQPLDAWGVKANSIGYLVSPDDAAVWRGPMASRALQQLINETLWPVLDYLIVDMPPGTGDIQLTMAQQVPLTAAVVVSTPQDIALADAQKGISMFEKVSIPVLGLIENMSYFECHHCGTRTDIFSHGGAQSLAERYQVPMLGAFPLDLSIREHADAGTPLLIEQPDSELSQAYRDCARRLSLQLARSRPCRADQKSHLKGNVISMMGQ